MVLLDYLVLFVYFLILIGIGVYSSMRIKKQEDFFLGDRSFGKLLQTFAAFGAGTGSSDPVNTARTTFTSGISGMWSVMTWLFVTPFYWITGVWYRRMRHLTLGDWFVERYESKHLGAAYCVFGLLFFMVYGSMFFSAIGKVAAPMMDIESVTIGGSEVALEYVLVPVIGVIVLVYGIAGGLRAAYLTDVIQGLCIIGLSVMLIPFGLQRLVDTDPSATQLTDGFRIMHERLSPEMFSIVGSTSTSDFPLHRIVAVVIMLLIGIVVQPHFIATGGGSAKTEFNARFGLVLGNFLKRFCTVGWVLTALIALTLYSNDPELLADPDRTWGIASRDLLGPGLTGLMLACLLAALISSIDTYMIVASGLFVRNLYAAYINDKASEREYLWWARLTGGLVVLGAVLVSLFMMDVFSQLQLTWVFPVLFAAPFWVGMYWRRATTTAAWVTVAFCALTFFGIPFLAPRLAPALRDQSRFLQTNRTELITTSRPAVPADLPRFNAGRSEQIATWETAKRRIDRLSDSDQQAYETRLLGPKPQLVQAGDIIEVQRLQAGRSVFWGEGVKPIDPETGEVLSIQPQAVGDPRRIDDRTTATTLEYGEDVTFRGFGNFKLDYLLYDLVGVDLRSVDNATLATLEMPPKIVGPFIVMIVVSLLTRRNSKTALDAYYAKMKTPVDPEPKADAEKLANALNEPEALEAKKLFPGSDFEFQRPSPLDIVGFIISFLACFAIIGLAALVGRIGS